MQELRQSTTATLKIGPFLDVTDGDTEMPLLAIAQADVRLSKNGGDIAQKNEATACTHDELAIYGCPIDATDTDTLGRLQLFVHEATALFVWHEYMVISQNEWDSKYSTDYKHVDVIQIEGGDASDGIRDAVVDDATRIDASALNALSGNDPGSQLAAQTDVTALNDLTAAQVRDAVVDDATRIDASALNTLAGNDPGSQLAAQSDITVLNNLSAAQVLAQVAAALNTAIPGSPTDDSVNERLVAVDALTESGGAGDLAAILIDTAALQADWANGGRLDLILDAILADTGTDGVVISTATAQAITDEFLKRGVDNVEDLADVLSVAALILAAFKSTLVGTVWTIKKSDGSTTFDTKTVTVDADADPIVAVT